MVDPIVDMLNRIRNGQAAGHLTVDFPFSNLKYQIVKIFEKQGLVEKVEKIKNRKVPKAKPGAISNIEVSLRYADKIPAISGLKMVSKSGQRIYVPWKKIKRTRGGYGMAIISTSKGLMSNMEAKKQKLGGEIICEIW